jgi:hypothetical protein
MEITKEEKETLLEALKLGAWVVNIEMGKDENDLMQRAIAILKP